MATAPAVLVAATIVACLVSTAVASGASTNSTIFHIIPHSHCDAGYRLTLEGYYDQRVQFIISTVVEALAKDPSKRFQWEEVATVSPCTLLCCASSLVDILPVLFWLCVWCTGYLLSAVVGGTNCRDACASETAGCKWSTRVHWRVIKASVVPPCGSLCLTNQPTHFSSHLECTEAG